MPPFDPCVRLRRALCATSIWSLCCLGADAHAVEAGERLPDLPTVSAAMGGEVVLVNVWASWCAPCRKELPVLESLHKRLGDVEARVVTLNIDTHLAPATGIVRHLGLSMPVVYDTDGRIADALAPPALPASYLVDADGVVVAVIAGGIEAAMATELERQMRALVKPEGGP